MSEIGWILILVAAIALAMVIWPVALSVSENRDGPLFRFAKTYGHLFAVVSVSLLFLLAGYEAYRGALFQAFSHALAAVAVLVATAWHRSAPPSKKPTKHR